MGGTGVDKGEVARDTRKLEKMTEIFFTLIV